MHVFTSTRSFTYTSDFIHVDVYVHSCNCEVMPTAMECVSCCEIEQVANMMKDFDLVQCITDHEGFQHVCVLNMRVLQATSFSYRHATIWHW